MMERTAWTDERLDDLSGEVRELRREMRAEFSDVRSGMRTGFREVRDETEALRLTVLRVGGGMLIGLTGVIAAILARGV